MLRATDILARDEIAALRTPSDLRGMLSVATTIVGITGAFAAVALWPHPVVVLAALVVIGGRQLALAVLMHECAHRSLFATAALNEWVGRWLCAAPIWTRLDDYRRHHVAHHARTGSEEDPDLGLVTPFPTTRWGLARKLLRDLTGLSGLRRVVALIAMDLGRITWTASTQSQTIPNPGTAREQATRLVRNICPTLATNALLLALLTALGHPALYGLWVGAWLTTYGMFMRIRSIAEHAVMERSADPLRNTRTTSMGWIARCTVAPHDVGYHLEHHLLPTVPHYRLRALHRLLADRGHLTTANTKPGYLAVLAEASAGE